MAKVLTARAVEAAKGGDTRREIPDGGLPGLYLVVQPSGVKSWAVRYRHDGKPRKFTVGGYPLLSLAEARARAGEALRQAAEGTDPGETAKVAREQARMATEPDKDTWEAVVDRFIRQYAMPRNRSWREAERVLAKDVTPHWRGRPITNIAKRDVVALTDALAEAGKPALANRVLQHIKRVMSWCVEKDLIQDSPARTVKAPAPLRTRDRVLTDDEIGLFWRAAERMGAPWEAPLKLLLLTGQRRSEVVEMEWRELEDLDGPAPTWIIAARRAKNGVEHGVPLVPAAAALVRQAPRIERCPFVFTTTGNSPLSGLSKSKARLDAFILDELRATDPEAEPPPPWTLHDLRRTFASGAAALGVRLEVIERCLNHVSGSFRGIVSVYQRHEFGAEKRAALEAWAAHVARVVEGRDETNVVALAEAR